MATMTWKDLNKLLKGSQKINRLQNEISAISSIINGIAKKIARELEPGKRVTLLKKERFGSFEISVEFENTEDNKVRGIEVFKKGEARLQKGGLPLGWVPEVHELLPEIVTKICENCPEIKEKIIFLDSMAD